MIDKRPKPIIKMQCHNLAVNVIALLPYVTTEEVYDILVACEKEYKERGEYKHEYI